MLGYSVQCDVYHWFERNEKYLCFDFVDLVGLTDIKSNLGIDIGFVPLIGHGKHVMRYHNDEYGLWAKVVELSLSEDEDASKLAINRITASSVSNPNISRCLQKLEHCTGDEPEALHNHLKQDSLKIQDLK